MRKDLALEKSKSLINMQRKVPHFDFEQFHSKFKKIKVTTQYNENKNHLTPQPEL